MMTNEERLCKIKERKKRISSENGRKRRRMLEVGTVILSICLVVFVGGYVGSLEMSNVCGDMSCTEGAASIIVDGGIAGYIVVGVLCFLLGVSLTFLMHKLHNMGKKGDK